MISLGISVSDYMPDRGHIDPEVYARVDYIEYGGHFPPVKDLGVERIRALGHAPRMTRHLVSVELPAELDVAAEVESIRNDLAGVRPEYLVTDFGYWRLGGRELESLWFRPCTLSEAAASRIAHNAEALGAELGMAVHPENPFSLSFVGELNLSDFMRALAERGAKLCFDVGHFYAVCVNTGTPVHEAFERLPFEAFRVAHIAGLSSVEYGGQRFLLDNHNVPPLPECVELLAEAARRSPGMQWVTYEAELASTDVQHAGLDAIARKLR
ncbi:multinuclear nonheme iron-dependent oxidase [Archangium lipolyticum]|uniref:multinuclear nonheme iron-dependent oxidase n=1 Tax=Archangium lipolyticum TaxID=2970465 RepID=UPI00214A0804|nr:DUF692 family multinuclear iron-containing protein [Archangium lipolyticum]